MQKRARSILDELDSISKQRDSLDLLESRATHVMQSAMNLISHIVEQYDAEAADELEKRLLTGIRNRDPDKFIRSLRKYSRENKRNN
ncbi:hypothetical protein UFOVP116_72 [uncultured Caudovirales phage]|uniref:Uncharacterized protein n=1 Tax=uncultured Caudovirales phage TaxID=2100421 RepID=A0A6J5L4I5_9CAUD|nr:hypothetical protein UFOVP116_72 [uncultured Caudovirales phage]